MLGKCSGRAQSAFIDDGRRALLSSSESAWWRVVALDFGAVSHKHTPVPAGCIADDVAQAALPMKDKGPPVLRHVMMAPQHASVRTVIGDRSTS